MCVRVCARVFVCVSASPLTLDLCLRGESKMKSQSERVSSASRLSLLFCPLILHRGGNVSIPTFINMFPAVDHFPLNTTQEVTLGAETVTALPFKLIK